MSVQNIWQPWKKMQYGKIRQNIDVLKSSNKCKDTEYQVLHQIALDFYYQPYGNDFRSVKFYTLFVSLMVLLNGLEAISASFTTTHRECYKKGSKAFKTRRYIGIHQIGTLVRWWLCGGFIFIYACYQLFIHLVRLVSTHSQLSK